MTRHILRTTAGALLLAALPGTGYAQSDTGNVTPSAVAPAPTPQSTAVAGTATAPADNVHHLRQLVRDVESNTDNIKSKGTFGAQLWLVEGQQFFEDWVKPGTPNIDPVAIVPRNTDVYSVVIFYGLAHDNSDLSNVSYDITVYKPDGSVYSQTKNLIGWQGLAPQESNTLELGRDHVSINVGTNDPAGLYAVEALVRDNVSRASFTLKQTFVVQ